MTNKLILIIASFLIFQALGLSQNMDVPITLKAKNITLGEALKRISTQIQTPISYSNHQVPADNKVNLNFNRTPLEKVFYELLSPYNLDFLFIENQIIIKPQKNVVHDSEIPIQTSQKYTISGIIKDKDNGEVIVGATIYTADLKTGTTSNKYGFYSLTLPQGVYRMHFSFIGYKTSIFDINLNKDINNFSISLPSEEMLLEAVVITHVEDSNKIVTANQTGFVTLESKKVSQMPMFFSEPDVIKGMQFLPGIKNTIDGSSNYYVRGGNRDQNLILLDDAPVYNPSHLFGFFSCINPEAVTDLKIYKSDFPAYVGGKLSSVLEMKTKEGNLNRLSGAVDLGLIANRYAVEAPIVKDVSSVYISYRRSHIGSLFKAANPAISDFKFDDFNTKFNVRINTKNRLLFSYYAGNDYFYMYKKDNDKNGINWGNRASSLRWNRIINNKLFSNLTLYYSKYDYNFFNSVDKDTRWTTGISTLGLKNDFTYYASPEKTHFFGFSLSNNSFNPGLYINHPYPPGVIPDISTMKTGEMHLYYASEKKLQENFILKYALRGILFSNKGPAERYILSNQYKVVEKVNENGRYYNTLVRLAPALTATYMINLKNAIKFNYFRAYQFHQILSNSISPFTSVEIWYPSTPNVKPQAADQLSLGYYTMSSNNMYSFNIEGFYKYLHNQFDYHSQAHFILNPHIEKELRFGYTQAYGFEATLKKEFGKLQAWLGYAYTRSVRTTKDINQNQSYVGYGDVPIDISLYMHYQLHRRWLFTSGFIYASGMVFTAPSGYYNYMGYKVPIYNQKNNARMPDYYRWDMSIQLQLNKPGKRFRHYMSFSIYNLTNKKNPVFINFNKIQDENGRFIIPTNYADNYKLSPSQTILLGVIPSLKYNLSF